MSGAGDNQIGTLLVACRRKFLEESTRRKTGTNILYLTQTQEQWAGKLRIDIGCAADFHERENHHAIGVRRPGIPAAVVIATESMSTSIQSAPLISTTFRNAITNSLQAWYTVTRRDLPWRLHRDPYAVWVSEVMLQQTQVKTTTPYYLRWMKRFPTIDHLARADISEVLKLWEGLGYYSRARNLHRAARQVSEVWKGHVPDDWESLRALPGIGDYIAAAVLSIAFEQPYAVVDGNVKRVLARLWCLDSPVNQSGGQRIYQAIAQQLLSSRSPGDHNQAMMELGALVCTPARPACVRCPLAGHCCAYGRGLVDRFPLKIPKAAVPVHHFAAGVLLKNQRMLIVQRPENGLLGGLWEFPNGPVPPDSDPAAALAAHINGQVNLDVKVGQQVALVRHTYSHFKLHLAIHVCRWRAGRVHLNGPVAFQWVRWDQIERFALHRAVQKALPAVARFLSG